MTTPGTGARTTRAEPVLGIGLPVRNGEKVLAETLNSLLAQRFGDLELVVVDNASTDATEEIVRSFAAKDGRIGYVRQERDVGILANFNAAFELSRGEYFMWAANDLYDPRFLGRCLELLAERPDAVAASTKATEFEPPDILLERLDEDITWDHPDPLHRFLDFASFRHHSLAVYAVMRRAAMARTQLKLPFWGSDRLFLAEMALQGPLLLDDESLFFSRSHRDFKPDHRRPPRSYLVGLGQHRALTVHYGRELARSLVRFGIPPAQRRRIMARWAWENRERLARSLARGGIETARAGYSSVSRRLHPAPH